MATRQNLTLRQSNDETITVTIAPDTDGDDLSGIVRLEFVLKPDGCADDDDTYALLLSTADASEATILTQSASEITAEAYVPDTYLAEPYARVWRVDAIGASGERRTAVYGSITVLDT